MRINDIITETATESQELAQFSTLVAKYLIQYYLRTTSDPASQKFIKNTLDNLKNNPADHTHDIQLTPDVNLSDIPAADHLLSPGLQLLKQHGKVSISALAPRAAYADSYGFSSAPGGHYYPHSNLIEVDVNHLELQSLITILTHEFQHAIDDLKSRRDQASQFRGRALRSGKTRGKNPDEKFLIYLQLPHEVNARFAEVITTLKTAIEDNTAESAAIKPTLASWMPYIRELFKYFQIDEAMPQGIDDPRYRKLLKRAYVWVMKFYQDRFHSDERSSG